MTGKRERGKERGIKKEIYKDRMGWGDAEKNKHTLFSNLY